MKGIVETQLRCDLFDENAGFLQAFRGEVHPETHQELVRRLVIVAAEQSAKIGRSHVALPSDLGKTKGTSLI